MIFNMKFKQKKGFLVRDFVVSGILFGIVIALLILQVASVAQNYGNTDIISPNFAAHYSQLQNNLNNLNTSTSAVQSSGGLNLIGTFNVAFNSIFTVIKMVWDSVLIYTGMASNVSGDFPFLDQTTVLMVLGGIIAIITTYLVFIWLSSISRGKI